MKKPTPNIQLTVLTESSFHVNFELISLMCMMQNMCTTFAHVEFKHFFFDSTNSLNLRYFLTFQVKL